MEGLVEVRARLLEAVLVLLCLVASHDRILHILAGMSFNQLLRHVDSLVEIRNLARDLDEPLLLGGGVFGGMKVFPCPVKNTKHEENLRGVKKKVENHKC